MAGNEKVSRRTMRELFRGYYRPSEAEFKKLWDEALFVPDASLLLNLYRYSGSARKQLIQILKAVGDRLWVPYQAALEFQRNRLSVIQKQKDMHADLQNELKKVRTQLENKAAELKRHPVLEPDVVLKHVNNFTSQLDKYLAKHEKPYPFKSDLTTEDPIRQELTKVIDDRVGPPLNHKELDEISEVGERRYEKKVPPGYLDADKDDESRYGDLILWIEIINRAQLAGTPIIFVTDDEKEDWWWRFKGQTLGPRPELIQELYERASVQLYMYNSSRFIDEARRYFSLDVSDETIEEVQTVREMSIKDETTRAGRSARGVPLSRRTFTQPEAELACGMTRDNIDYWTSSGIVHTGLDTDGVPVFRYRDLLLLRVLHELAISRDLSMDVIEDLSGDIEKRIGLAGRLGFLVVTESQVTPIPAEDIHDFEQDVEETSTILNVRHLIRSVNAGIKAL